MATPESIERLLEPAFCADLALRTDAELRAMKERCSDAENAVSYYRRMVQGRIEIISAWREQRREGGSVEDLVADLPRILAGSAPRSAPAASRFAAPALPEVELEWPGDRQRLVADETLARLPTLDDDEIVRHLDELESFEAELSDVRRRLHDVLDALEAEIARRAAGGDAAR